MRLSAVVLALLFAQAPLPAQQPAERSGPVAEKANGAPERNVQRLAAEVTDTRVGTFDAGTLVIDRARADQRGAGCNAVSADSPMDDVPFVALALQATATANLEAVVNAAQTTLVDTVFFLYCDPFDPFDPLSNLIAADDDDGGGPNGQLSAFTASDGIVLQPGQTYWLVMTTFGGFADFGSYQIDVSGATIVTSVPVEIQSFRVD